MKTRNLLLCVLLLGAPLAYADSSEGARIANEAEAKQTAQMKKVAEAQKKLKDKFDKADVDHDGKLTEAEAKAGMPKVYAHFKEIDKGAKGYVTIDDIRTYIGDQYRLMKSLAQ
jgi:hypothetical protein